MNTSVASTHMIVLPGGGYAEHAPHEAELVASWSSAGTPLCREPFKIRFVPGPRLLLTGEQRIGLVQDEYVGAALPPGHVGDGKLGGVDPGVDVPPALLGERPLEGASALVFKEYPETVAQLACAVAGGQFDRPVAGRALRTGKPGAEPCRAVGGQIAE